MSRNFLILVTVCFLFAASQNSQAHPGPFERPHGIMWKGSKCGNFAPSGDLIEWKDLDVCRKLIGSNLRWSGTTCVEVTPEGYLLKEFKEKSVCRCNVGTAYDMSGDSCGEFTPAPESKNLRWFKNIEHCKSEDNTVKLRCQ